MVGGPRLSVGGQMDGVIDTIGAVIVDQRRHNAAVSLAIACVFLESNVAATPRIISDKKNKVLSYLPVYNVSILVGLATVTAVMEVSGGIEIGV